VVVPNLCSICGYRTRPTALAAPTGMMTESAQLFMRERSPHTHHRDCQQRQHQFARHQLHRRRRPLAPLRDLLGERQAGVEEQRLVAVPEESWKFWREPGREQAVEHRGRHDEQHRAAGDVVAGEFQEQGCGGERWKALQDGGQRKAFEAVQRG